MADTGGYVDDLVGVLGGAGQFMSGLGGLLPQGGQKMDYMATNWTTALNAYANKRMIEWQAENMPSLIQKGAKKAGIHPLVALGIQPQGGSFARPVTLDNPSRDLAAMGQAMTRLSMIPEVRRKQERDAREQESIIALNQARAQYYESQAKTTGSGSVIPGQPDSNKDAGVQVMKNRVPSTTSVFGYLDGAVKSGSIPRMGWTQGPTGAWRLMRTEELGEILEEALVGNFQMNLEEAKLWIQSWFNKGPKPYWQPNPGYKWKGTFEGWIQVPVWDRPELTPSHNVQKEPWVNRALREGWQREYDSIGP